MRGVYFKASAIPQSGLALNQPTDLAPTEPDDG
jgi:hypothetical protein